MARILAVDDDPLIREILRLMLTKLGHSVTLTENGILAKEILSKECSNFDCLVSDRMMPGLDGIRLIEWVRAESQNTKLPCVLLSADNRTEIVVDAVVMEKPFTPADIERSLSKAMSI